MEGCLLVRDRQAIQDIVCGQVRRPDVVFLDVGTHGVYRSGGRAEGFIAPPQASRFLSRASYRLQVPPPPLTRALSTLSRLAAR